MIVDGSDLVTIIDGTQYSIEEPPPEDSQGRIQEGGWGGGGGGVATPGSFAGARERARKASAVTR